MCESSFQVTSKKGLKPSKAGYLRMKISLSLKANTITSDINEQVDGEGEKQFDRFMIAAVSYHPNLRTKVYNRTHCG